ncbi:MAG: Gfo/Idh/MocA family oxidoreductase [Spirochaetes bacterium]|nr:Gfo/Idh/MocA family oxidoreductase [Spirochaetota bacterium]
MKYKAVIIGTGRIGYLLQKDKKREQPASHALALHKNKSIILKAGCDINQERLDLFKKDYPKTNIYTDHKKMMEIEKPDIVVVAVEEAKHSEITCSVMKYKPKLIILEKPVATTIKEAERIKKSSEQYKIPIIINHERRYSEDYKYVKELLKKDSLGDIHFIGASFWSNNRIFHKDSFKHGSCSLVHDGTHLVDLLHFLIDCVLKDPKIDKVIKNKKNEVRQLNFHYDIKGKNIIYIDFNGNKDYFGFEVEIRGEKGRIIIGNGYLKVYEAKPSLFYSNFKSLIKNKKIKRPKKTKYFSNMVQNCVNYLDKKDKIISPLSEGIKTLKVLHEIIKELK